MRVIHDLRCTSCGAEESNVAVDPTAFPKCQRCGGARTWIPARINTDIFGGPTYVTSLDETFSSKSDLRAHLKANGLQEAGDRVGGARNTSHLNLGKTFSYKGQVGRTTQAETAGRRSRART